MKTNLKSIENCLILVFLLFLARQIYLAQHSTRVLNNIDFGKIINQALNHYCIKFNLPNTTQYHFLTKNQLNYHV